MHIVSIFKKLHAGFSILGDAIIELRKNKAELICQQRCSLEASVAGDQGTGL